LFSFLPFEYSVLLCVQSVQVLGITATLVLLIYPVALKRGYFEVYATEFNDITHAKSRCLKFGTKVLEDLVYASLFAYDEPHCPLQINVVLLIFLLIPTVLARVDFIDDNSTSLIWNLFKVLAVNCRSVEAPESAFTMLIKKPKYEIVRILVVSEVDALCLLTLDSNDVSQDEHIEASLLL